MHSPLRGLFLITVLQRYPLFVDKVETVELKVLTLLEDELKLLTVLLKVVKEDEIESTLDDNSSAIVSNAVTRFLMLFAKSNPVV